MPVHSDLQVVSGVPEVCVLPRSATQQSFVILATDGLWSCCSSAEAIQFVSDHLAGNDSPQAAADSLLNHALMDRQASDNVLITVIVINPLLPRASPSPVLHTGGAASVGARSSGQVRRRSRARVERPWQQRMATIHADMDLSLPPLVWTGSRESCNASGKRDSDSLRPDRDDVATIWRPEL